MIKTNLDVLKINRLTKAQYKKALSEGLIEDNELYMTPEEELPDLSAYATKDYVDKNGGKIDSIKLNGSPLSIVNKSVDIILNTSAITQDATHRFVTDEEKVKWNAKSNFSGSYNDLANKPNIPSKTSQLDNDKGFITADQVPEVNLSSYYTKVESDGRYVNLSGTQTIAGAKTFSAALQVNNNIAATGTITGSKVYGAVWNDYAEWFEKERIKEKFKPGDICVWAGSGVEKSKFAKDVRVIGVVSDTYGYIVGGEHLADMEENHKKFVPICLKGRVRCNVKGPVNVGDLIITSDIEGVGQVDNTCDNQTLVGKALESSNEDGIKSILILV